MRHGHSRLGGTGGRSTTSPPVSPRPRLGKRFFGVEKGSNLVEKLVFLVVSCVFRKKGVLLFAPVFYILGMLVFMGSFGFDVEVSIRGRSGRGESGPAPPGSVYRSPEVLRELWPFMEAEVFNSTDNAIIWLLWLIWARNESLQLTMAWTQKSNETWMPCVSSTVPRAALPESNGFLIIEANGGLNQQRLSICDVVAVAGLLNATLIIPIFHLNSVWRDSSNFSDIFDEEFFIESLGNKVRVLRQLPEDVLQQYDHDISSIINLRVKAWSSPSHYLQKVLPKMKELGVVRIAPFGNRLAQAVPSYVQGLRCFANFESLRFAEYIRMLGDKMVERMTRKSSGHEGRYVSVHLRFEKDMVAFSCCEYDGGKEETKEMDIARERGWRGKFRKKGRMIRPGVNRMDGKCPLTPLEVGMMLRGMGFNNTTFLYIASGKIYEEEKYMAPLKMMFPNLQTKDTLASPEELAPLQGFSSRLAAIDYTVCLHSEVFVTTQGGNFPHFLIGHRRYLFGGHSKTIRPDKRKLALLFDNPKIRWEYFKRQMKEMLRRSDAKGIELKKPSSSVYTFPMPDCMCKQERSNSHSQE